MALKVSSIVFGVELSFIGAFLGYLRNKRFQIAAAVTMMLLTVWLLFFKGSGSTSEPVLRSRETLMKEAMLEGKTVGEQSRRRNAARDLALQAEVATQSLRRLAVESRDSAVRATAMQGLGKARDVESVNILVDALEDDDAHVRGQANAALIRIYQTDLGFRAQDPPAKRGMAAREWRNAVGGSGGGR